LKTSFLGRKIKFWEKKMADISEKVVLLQPFLKEKK